MRYTPAEVLGYVKENDVKFVKLTFCDLFGRQKNFSVVASQLKKVFAEGFLFDASDVPGFSGAQADLKLLPDAGSLYALPWRPQSRRAVSLFCRVAYADGKPFEADGQYCLDRAADRLKALRLDLAVSFGCGFYVCKCDESGEPTFEPYDRATYCDISPIDRCEDLRRDIVLSLESMGLQAIASYHERGPGQNRIDFVPVDPLSAAKDLLLFKSTVKNICRRDGLFATFMPKPFAEEARSSLQVKLVLKGTDAAAGDRRSGLKEGQAESFLEGMLVRLPELMPFTDPTTNSYGRSVEGAPRSNAWSQDNGNRAIQYRTGSDGFGFVLRHPDAAVNPMLLLGLLIHAGLDGIEEKRVLRPAVGSDQTAEALPATLDEAIGLAQKSAWLKRHLPSDVLACYFAAKRGEIARVTAGERGEEERRLYRDV